MTWATQYFTHRFWIEKPMEIIVRILSVLYLSNQDLRPLPPKYPLMRILDFPKVLFCQRNIPGEQILQFPLKAIQQTIMFSNDDGKS